MQQIDKNTKGERYMEEFSLNTDLLRDILRHAKPMGHNEKPGNLNLGFGFVYYGIVRALRPKHVLVIGSGFGFSVVCLALGIKDNGVGNLTFVDPSYSLLKNGPFNTVGGNGKWDDPGKVREHFSKFGVDGVIKHFKATSEEFFNSYDEGRLPPIDVAFIDGNHSYESVKYDFTSVLGRSHRNTYILLHDTNIYIRELIRHSGVKRWFNTLKKEEELFEMIDFPFSSGVALVRVMQDNTWKNKH
jgi:predicted O-methyltransferase YrrM